MGWIYFGVLAWVSAIIFVSWDEWKKYWPIGLFSMAAIFLIDNTFVSINAFRFHHQLITVGALPLAYWISYFPGGILFAHYRPVKGFRTLGYVLISAFLLLLAELIFEHFGYFQYVHWNAARSYVLNSFGFASLFWFNEFWESNIIAKPPV